MYPDRKRLLFTCIAILGIRCSLAQQLPLYSMYMMNGFVIDPAVAGSDGYTTIGLSTRDHMLGFEKSPKTYVLNFQTRILRQPSKVRKKSIFKGKSLSNPSGRVGIGGYIFNDKNGVIQRTGGSLSYAYHIYMQNTQLSFGLAVSTFQFKIAQDELKFRDQSEPSLNESFANRILVPDVTVGTYVLSPSFFYGLSIANLFQTRLKVGNETYDYRMYRHYFLMGGKQFNREDTYSYEPSFLLKATEKTIFQADLQMRMYYKQDFYMGICYRTGSSIGLLLGAKWSRLQFGYAFDYGLNSIQKYNYGAHELNLAIKLGDNARRYRWLIRY
jgi:type IX secretion system PorP/SprF family membrane protein